MRNRPDYRDEDQRFFPVREIDEQEAERAKRALVRQNTPTAEPEPPPPMSRQERLANIRRLSDMVEAALDGQNQQGKSDRQTTTEQERRTRGGQG